MENNRSVIDYLQTVVFSYITHEQKLLIGPYFRDAVNKHKHEIITSYLAGDCQNQTAEQYYNETYGK
jgi:hypothetical protein